MVVVLDQVVEVVEAFCAGGASGDPAPGPDALSPPNGFGRKVVTLMVVMVEVAVVPVVVVELAVVIPTFWCRW